MKIIRNKYLPVGNFGCMNILGFLFVREEVELTDTIINHEAIHSVQQNEIMTTSALVAVALSTFFASWWYLSITIAMPIIVYVLAWLIEFVLPPYDSAYKDSPFEREAYENEDACWYLANRTPFAWVRYILRSRK